MVAPYYASITDLLIQGARRRLMQAGVKRLGTLKVPGALEIPQAVRIRHGHLNPGESGPWHGYVALGCVIRGETSHYDIVAGESARGLMRVGLQCHLPIGNGILTVDSFDQAEIRADPERGDKGGHAAEACLSLMRIAGMAALP